MTAGQPPSDAELELLCPACAYDLRAAASDRCPECGLVINRDSLRTSGLPWAHRRKIGRFRAYIKTLWQITWDSAALRHEPSRDQEPRDARSFSRITATLLSVTFLGTFAAVTIQSDGYKNWAVQRATPFIGPASDLPEWMYDIAVPWSAGAVFPPVLPICLALLAFYVIALPRPVLRVPTSAAAQGRAQSLAHYVTAPLALLLPGLACLLLAPWVETRLQDFVERPANAWRVSLVFIVLGTALCILGIGMTFLRAGQWAARARHDGAGRAGLAAAELAVLWLIAAIVFIGLVPWCVGLVWALLDSFRN